MRVAVHSRIHPDKIADYEAAHREVPEEIPAAMREAGCRSWSIWRSGVDLFHFIECDDYPALLARLGREPANTAWHARMSGLLEAAADFSAGEGATDTLPLVWELTAAADTEAQRPRRSPSTKEPAL
jgi:L-rhamnose mutarotase